jgi:hypothetical protein
MFTYKSFGINTCKKRPQMLILNNLRETLSPLESSYEKPR